MVGTPLESRLERRQQQQKQNLGMKTRTAMRRKAMKRR
jgi:hypothetical protein